MLLPTRRKRLMSCFKQRKSIFTASLLLIIHSVSLLSCDGPMSHELPVLGLGLSLLYK